MSPKKLSIERAADRLGVSIRKVDAYIRKGKLSTTTKKARIFVFTSEVDALKKRRDRILKFFGVRKILLACFSLLFITLGLGHFLARDIYDKYLYERFWPAVTVYPKALSFDRTYAKSTQNFTIINESDRLHFNIEILVILEAIDQKYEHMEVKSAEKPNKKYDRKIGSHTVNLEVGVIRGMSFVSDKREMLIVKLAEIGPRQSKLFEVEYKSSDHALTSSMKHKYARVPVEVKSYSKAGVGTYVMESPSGTIKPKTASAEKLKKFDFEGHVITVFVDEHGDPWFFVDEICTTLQVEKSQRLLCAIPTHERTVLTLTDNSGQLLGKYPIIGQGGLNSLLYEIGKENPLRDSLFKWVANVLVPQIYNK